MVAGLVVFVLIGGPAAAVILGRSSEKIDSFMASLSPPPSPSPSNSSSSAPSHGDNDQPRYLFDEEHTGFTGLALYRPNARLVRPLSPCLVHSFDERAAYVTDCLGLPSVTLMYVGVYNGLGTKRFPLARFRLTDERGRTIAPTDVRAIVTGRGLFPVAAKIGDRKWQPGWIAFKVRGDALPDHLAYNGPQRVTIWFRGDPSVERM